MTGAVRCICVSMKSEVRASVRAFAKALGEPYNYLGESGLGAAEDSLDRCMKSITCAGFDRALQSSTNCLSQSCSIRSVKSARSCDIAAMLSTVGNSGSS